MNASNTHTVVLAAIDRAATSDDVIRSAIALSRASASGELHFVHVDADRVAGNAYLDAIVARARDLTTARVAGHLETGSPLRCILQSAGELRADYLVVGAPASGGIAWLSGSLSRKLVRRAPCAVLLARPRSEAVPEIEPACPACTDIRFATGGAQLWCARHAVHHVHGHLHYGASNGYGAGAMFVRSDS